MEPALDQLSHGDEGHVDAEPARAYGLLADEPEMLMRHSHATVKRPVSLGKMLATLALAMAFAFGTVLPAAAHTGWTTRAGGYNVVKTWVAGGVCNYNVQHGNYGGAYINVKLNSASCHAIDFNVTGCVGLNCPTFYGVTLFEHGMWASAGFAGWNIIHSHNQIYWNSGGNTLNNKWHNTLS